MGGSSLAPHTLLRIKVVNKVKQGVVWGLFWISVAVKLSQRNLRGNLNIFDHPLSSNIISSDITYFNLEFHTTVPMNSRSLLKVEDLLHTGLEFSEISYAFCINKTKSFAKYILSFFQ